MNKSQKILGLTFLILVVLALSNFLNLVSATTSIKNDRDSVEMILIPAGEFLMGSALGEGRTDERPQRKVYLDAYEIDVTETTNDDYLKFIHSTRRKEPINPYSDKKLSTEPNIGDLPVVQITWYDAVDYCRWVGKRLPTEAEWEKAARGDKGFIFPWGSDSPKPKEVNFQKNWEGTNTLWPVGSVSQNSSPYGVKDMAGNVREWTNDWYSSDYYSLGINKNPKGPQKGILKVIKDGSWHSFKADIRSAARGKGGFALKTDGIGFRCAKSIK